MSDAKSINNVQAHILRRLFTQDGLRFAEIKDIHTPSDQFSYHLRQLQKLGLIEKSEDLSYRLTPVGKQQSILLSPSSDRFIDQGFLAVRVVLTKLEDGVTYYLMRQRQLVPYKGQLETPGDKIMRGETVLEAAKRAVFEQTGLTCDIKVLGLQHSQDIHNGQLMQDKYFFVCHAQNPIGQLKKLCRNGKHIWLTYEQIQESNSSIHGGLEILNMLNNESFSFTENAFNVNDY
ncbi:MAG: NUDIX domain-containing protein [Candidatus Saccharibacteria bacterium]|nr:NUDIX domain-containing protein [Candidatus Saccharibacteria bacterium]